MKLRYPFLIILFYLVLLPITSAEESHEQDVINIVTYEEDLTGDGNKEAIQLEGVLLSETSTYYHLVWATITSFTGDVWEVHFPGGSNPSLQFVNVTGDGGLDLLYESTLDYHQNTFAYELYKIEEQQIVPIPLPKETFVHGSFQDQFLVHVFVTPHQEPVIIDLKEHANEYVEAGVYDKSGLLREQRDITVEPIREVRSFILEEPHKYGLISTQRVHASPYTEHLGNIQSKWIFENHAWKLLESTWK